MKNEVLLSICIPSYNRPAELKRLLDSIDATYANIEIVVGEDFAPLRDEVRTVVDEFKSKTVYPVIYIENEQNYGYDKNLRNIGKIAHGDWIIMMGDDDVFVPGSLDKYFQFLCKNKDLGYVLRRYVKRYSNNEIEDYRYSKQDVFFDPGEKTVVELFRRSLFISGFTYKREYFSDCDCTDYDGTLLFQLYILTEICLKHPAAYCDIPITGSIEGGIPYFGVGESEKNLYESGVNSVNNSLNFMKQVEFLTTSIDAKFQTNMREKIIFSYSKYSFGFLHEHRDEGVKIWNQYVKGLRKLGFDGSVYFNIYYFMLLIFGKRGCQRIIIAIKRLIGSTPRL